MAYSIWQMVDIRQRAKGKSAQGTRLSGHQGKMTKGKRNPDSATHNGMLIFAANSKTWAKIAKAKAKSERVEE